MPGSRVHVTRRRSNSQGIVTNVTYPYLLWEPKLAFGLDSAAGSQIDPIDWPSVASSRISYNQNNYPISFVILRASKGAADIDSCQYEDPKFAERANAASAAGLIVGAYHFATIRDKSTHLSPIAEADFFVKVAAAWIKPGNMRPFLDVEDDDTNNPCYPNRPKDGNLADWVDQWMQEVKKLTGVTPIIYTNSLYIGQNNFKKLASKYELWVAENGCVRTSSCDPSMSLNSLPWLVDLIQYDWQGRVEGVDTNVDLDVFQGVRQTFESKLVIPR